MGQHRTRKQKELAQQHRIVSGAPGLYSLSSSSFSVKKTSVQTAHELEDRHYIIADLRKTVLVLLYVFALLGILWWKLK
ncbi:MAG TPA: hypothetical protein VFG51_03865 [Candidatus Saccharimonadia bacterium]|nr:hypothetical protein [Candidatus Saccharimonadia bacterium]